MVVVAYGRNLKEIFMNWKKDKEFQNEEAYLTLIWMHVKRSSFKHMLKFQNFLRIKDKFLVTVKEKN